MSLLQLGLLNNFIGAGDPISFAPGIRPWPQCLILDQPLDRMMVVDTLERALLLGKNIFRSLFRCRRGADPAKKNIID